MESRTFYYARVSSNEQNLDRQLAAFAAVGASERDIITDKKSGKDLSSRATSPLNPLCSGTVILLLLSPLTV